MKKTWITSIIILMQLVSYVYTQELVLIEANADKQVLVPIEDISTAWRTDLNYADSSWMLCQGGPGGIGFEKESGYESVITLDVADEMYDINYSCYIRIPFTVSSENLSELKSFTLGIGYDDGFIAYLNGKKIAEANAPTNPQWDSKATKSHEAHEIENFDIADHLSELKAGENLFAIHGLNRKAGNNDFLIIFGLSASTSLYHGISSSNLPVIIIDTHGQRIVDASRIVADMGIIYHEDGQRNDVNDFFNHYDGKIGIELRGASSLWFPKKPYRIETQDADGEDVNVSIFGMPAENDWVFHNPFSDKSLIRNIIAYKISNDLGRYATRTQLFELILNSEYQGVYVFMEKIKRDKNRVKIAKLDIDDVAGDSLTGGYIIKIDKRSGEEVGGWRSNNTDYQYHYPKPSIITDEQKQYIQNFIRNFETIMKDDAYNDPVNGYHKYFDLDSFVDFFIVNEVCRNIDGYRLSTFMYKDRDDRDGRLKMGPVWDFNLSLGNADYYDGWKTDGWNFDHLVIKTATEYTPPFWMKKIRDDTTFMSKLYQRWHTLRNNELDIDKLLNYIDETVNYLDEAQQRNFIKWPVLGVDLWPNWFVGQTYQEEIDFMKDWLQDRITWMDQAINEYSTFVAVHQHNNTPQYFSLEQNYPNPFNASTTISFNLPSSEKVELLIYDIKGRLVAKLISQELDAGNYTVNYDANDCVSGLYIYYLKAGKNSEFKRMVLLK